MATQNDRGAIDGGFGRGERITKKDAREVQDDDPELIDGDVSDFFDESDAAERRKDPLRGQLSR